jgi:hypothetical protein
MGNVEKVFYYAGSSGIEDIGATQYSAVVV